MNYSTIFFAFALVYLVIALAVVAAPFVAGFFTMCFGFSTIKGFAAR